ncbi:MAG: 8-amino-7-oxononanoate synthase [Gallionella sp.]|nr:8-amino-7-oxononanoate synthase [Gallionella sp.]
MPFSELQLQLDERAALGLLRSRRTVFSPQSPHIVVEGTPYLSFCSNDYLGLAHHPKLIAALQQGAQQWGAGAGSAHLVNGHFLPHEQLEHELADFAGKPAALLFSTGYMANLGVVQALAGRGDTVFADKLNHASLNDAMQLSRACVKRYRHNDIAQLESLLAQTNGHGKEAIPDDETNHARFPLSNFPPLAGARANETPHGFHVKAGRKLICTDAVFSMDGDMARLPELLALCEQYDAWLLVDDAHGFGVLGEQGRGSLAHFGINSKRIIYMATLGKAAGVFGAFVAAEQVVIDTLINHAGSYVYTTATPPALSVALLESLRLIRGGDELRAHLQKLIAQLRTGLANLPCVLMESGTAIQPLLAGENQAALDLSTALRERGIWVAAIRPPTVPTGTARLRITLSAAHTASDVDRLLEALHELAY